jgi:hypothetical protein
MACVLPQEIEVVALYAIEAGVAEIERVGRGAETATVTDRLTVPPAPVQLRV